ncbi:desulfoferrodoxin [Candidatus Pacearchaeota archaeon]|jgi:superoxide reductase|nr:desulfoferrodoxin [Candidatus Pacearchaeota archaeon]
MTSLNQIWGCEACGNIVTILHKGIDALVCCNQPMVLQKENTIDASHEKHIPIIEGNKVKIGSIEHPMEESHYIEWISATDGKITARVFLKPGQKPEAEFCFAPIAARCYCNLHGLWTSS